MLFRFLHALRRRHLWLLIGAACAGLAVLAYSGKGLSFLFGGSSVRLLFASLGGLGFATAGYWVARSTYNVFKTSRFALPLVFGSVVLTAGGAADVPALIDRSLGRELFTALVYLVPCVIGFMHVMQLKKRKTGHWSKSNQPGR